MMLTELSGVVCHGSRHTQPVPFTPSTVSRGIYHFPSPQVEWLLVPFTRHMCPSPTFLCHWLGGQAIKSWLLSCVTVCGPTEPCCFHITSSPCF